MPARLSGLSYECIAGLVQALKLWVLRGEMRNRGIDYAGLIGQAELNPFGERRFQRTMRLKAAIQRDGFLIVGAQFAGSPRSCRICNGAVPSNAANQLWKVRICTGRPLSSVLR